MPDNHSHGDRGHLHADCPACQHLLRLMSDAGVRPSPRFYLSPTVVSAAGQDATDFYTTTVQAQRPAVLNPGLEFSWVADDRPDLDIAGVEMGNKPVVDDREADQAELGWLTSLLNRARTVDLPYGLATIAAHAYLEHDHFMVPLMLTLRQAQEVHAGLHHAGTGHFGAADHFVDRFPREALQTRHRLLTQRADSAGIRALKAERHRRREQAARASREAAMVDSARALRRAIEHTKGTVLPRASFDTHTSAHVSIQVGVKDRITVATATIGHDTAIGTAICHPTDRFDAQIGQQLAIARALVALGAHHELSWMAQVAERNA